MFLPKQFDTEGRNDTFSVAKVSSDTFSVATSTYSPCLCVRDRDLPN